MRSGKGHDFFGALHRLCRASHQRRAHLPCNLACRHLVAQRLYGFRPRANPGQPRLHHGACKLRPLRQKAVARMYGIGPAAPGNVQQLGDVQIGISRAHAVQRPGFIGRAYMQGIGIRVCIDRDRGHTIVTAGTGDTYCDFSPVSNQHFADHVRSLSWEGSASEGRASSQAAAQPLR